MSKFRSATCSSMHTKSDAKCDSRTHAGSYADFDFNLLGILFDESLWPKYYNKGLIIFCIILKPLKYFSRKMSCYYVFYFIEYVPRNSTTINQELDQSDYMIFDKFSKK